MNPLVLVNAVLALGSAAAGVLALVRPAALADRPADDPAARFFARMYAARAVPFGVAVAAVLLLTPAQAPVWLVTAAVVQAADVVIGAAQRSWGMVPAPALTAAIHAASAAVLAA